MNPGDYQRVEQAIRFVDARREDQPTLAEIAAHVGLSAPYLQRVFKRWAGVSPKRFWQFLTVEHARRLLRNSSTVLDAANVSGLSSQGRLHDLFVSVEAVTPGECKRLGDELIIRYGFHSTPFGESLLACTDRGVCWLSFLVGQGRAAALRELVEEWPLAVIREDETQTGEISRRIFEPLGGGEQFPLKLLLKGTNFQVQVWRALLKIPEGSTASYQGLAKSLDRPRASRAVGSAVGRNPIAYLIPCHRVLRQVGELSGYRWGVARKQAMLGWESARAWLDDPVRASVAPPKETPRQD
ncbi:MAG: methylated-DNA--[protein]-cysteine S-methyltransferase [Planctomycetales bacterium]